ncbi:MAG: hypothetical protein ABIE94_02195 [archaeon]
MKKEEESDKLREYYESELKQRDRQIEELKRDNKILWKTALKQAERKIVEEELKKAKKKK